MLSKKKKLMAILFFFLIFTGCGNTGDNDSVSIVKGVNAEEEVEKTDSVAIDKRNRTAYKQLLNEIKGVDNQFITLDYSVINWSDLLTEDGLIDVASYSRLSDTAKEEFIQEATLILQRYDSSTIETYLLGVKEESMEIYIDLSSKIS